MLQKTGHILLSHLEQLHAQLQVIVYGIFLYYALFAQKRNILNKGANANTWEKTGVFFRV